MQHTEEDQTQSRWNIFLNGEFSNAESKKGEVNKFIRDDTDTSLKMLAAKLVRAVLNDAGAKPRLKAALYNEFLKFKDETKKNDPQEQAIYNIYNLVLEAKRDQFWAETLGPHVWTPALFALFGGMGGMGGVGHAGVAGLLPTTAAAVTFYCGLVPLIIAASCALIALVGILIYSAMKVEKKTKKLLNGFDNNADQGEQSNSVEEALSGLHNASGMTKIIEQFSFANKVAKVAESMWEGTSSFFRACSSATSHFESMSLRSGVF